MNQENFVQKLIAQSNNNAPKEQQNLQNDVIREDDPDIVESFYQSIIQESQISCSQNSGVGSLINRFDDHCIDTESLQKQNKSKTKPKYGLRNYPFTEKQKQLKQIFQLLKLKLNQRQQHNQKKLPCFPMDQSYKSDSLNQDQSNQNSQASLSQSHESSSQQKNSKHLENPTKKLRNRTKLNLQPKFNVSQKNEESHIQKMNQQKLNQQEYVSEVEQNKLINTTKQIHLPSFQNFTQNLQFMNLKPRLTLILNQDVSLKPEKMRFSLLKSEEAKMCQLIKRKQLSGLIEAEFKVKSQIFKQIYFKNFKKIHEKKEGLDYKSYEEKQEEFRQNQGEFIEFKLYLMTKFLIQTNQQKKESSQEDPFEENDSQIHERYVKALVKLREKNQLEVTNLKKSVCVQMGNFIFGDDELGKKHWKKTQKYHQRMLKHNRKIESIIQTQISKKGKLYQLEGNGWKYFFENIVQQTLFPQSFFTQTQEQVLQIWNKYQALKLHKNKDQPFPKVKAEKSKLDLHNLVQKYKIVGNKEVFEAEFNSPKKTNQKKKTKQIKTQSDFIFQQKFLELKIMSDYLSNKQMQNQKLSKREKCYWTITQNLQFISFIILFSKNFSNCLFLPKNTCYFLAQIIENKTIDQIQDHFKFRGKNIRCYISLVEDIIKKQYIVEQKILDQIKLQLLKEKKKKYFITQTEKEIYIVNKSGKDFHTLISQKIKKFGFCINLIQDC